MSNSKSVGISTFPSPFTPTTASTITTHKEDVTVSSQPPSPSSSPTISSLFPGLQVADHFLPDNFDDGSYYDNFIDDNSNNDVIQEHLSNSSSSLSFPCVSFNKSSILSSSTLSSSVQCPNSADLTKMKIYSSDDLWAENEIYAIKLAPAMAFIALLMVIGILGNILVVYVYGFRFKSATQHFLIVCLACFDLVMCIVAMPAEIADIRFHHTFTSVFACKLLRFVTMFASISSSFTLVTVAYDRHRRITRPLSKQISTQQARMWMLANMAASLCFSWPTLVLTGIRSSETGIAGLSGTDCSFSERFKKTKYPLAYNAVLGAGFFTLITVIAVFYFRIWKTAKTRKINMAKRYTISSLSDQSLNELKLQKQISKHGMSDVLSKQLEKCVREKLKTKPSIDCKDIYYFFENNSIRSTIGTGIAKKRGRYRGFSMSSEDSYKYSDESCVLGQSFSYRTSVNRHRVCKKDGLSDEEDDKDSHDSMKGDVSRTRRFVGRASSKLSKQSFSMAKIPEHSSSPYTCQNLDELQIDGLDSNAMYTGTFSVEETPYQLQACNAVNKVDDDNDIDKDRSNTNTKFPSYGGYGGNESNQNKNKMSTRSKIPCHSSRSNSPFLQHDENDEATTLTLSPSLSLKSANCSPSNSPGRNRRNSSPVIGQGRCRVKARVENSISVISDDFRPRPMSSLVDSVSQTLGRMQEFSSFEHQTTIATCPDLFTNKIMPIIMPMIHRNKAKTAQDMANESVEVSVLNPEVNQNHWLDSMSKDHCRHRIEIADNCDGEYKVDSNTHQQDLIIPTLETNQQPCTTGKPMGSEHESIMSESCTKEEVVLACSGVDDVNVTSFESFSHLIGSRSKPMEIPCSCRVANKSEYDRIVGTGDRNNSKDNCVLLNGEMLKDKDNYDEIHANGICNMCNCYSQSQNIDGVLGDAPRNNPTTENEMSVDKLCSYDLDQHQTSIANLTRDCSSHNHVRANTLSTSITDTLKNGEMSCKKPFTPTPSVDGASTTTNTTTISTTAALAATAATTCDISEVEKRVKPRSFSNCSLDTIASATPRRRNKNSSRCLCISQNLDKTTVVAFTVSSVFILSFLPFLTLMFIRGLVKDFDYSLDGPTLCIYHILLRFYFLNSAINPFLYGLLNVNFRHQCVRTWKKFATCCHGNDKTRTKKDSVIY